MNLLDTLTRITDTEQLCLHPLPEHAISKEDEHLRRNYALLLCAVLTAQEQLSEAQSRLLVLLLDSLKLGDIRSALFEEAREFDESNLAETARLIRESGFAKNLILDCLVCLRIEQPLTDSNIQLLGVLSAFLDTSAQDMTVLAQNTAEVLGLTSNEREVNENGTSSSKQLFNFYEYWPGQLPKKLTAENLKKGISGGIWYLDETLKVNFNWHVSNANLVFYNDAILSLYPEDRKKTLRIRLDSCKLYSAQLDIQGKTDVEISKCTFKGGLSNKRHKNSVALRCCGETIIKNTSFNTKNYGAIRSDGKLTVEGCSFFECGNPNGIGGAIYHTDSPRKIVNNTFDSCTASHGGAIYIETAYGIENCKFISCSSSAMNQEKGSDAAVFANYAAENFLNNCMLTNTSLYVCDVRSISIGSCYFIGGNYFYNSGSDKYIKGQASFDKGAIVQISDLSDLSQFDAV